VRGIIISREDTPNTMRAYGMVVEGEPEKFSFVMIGNRLGMITEVMRRNELYAMLPSLARVDVDALEEHLRASEWHQTVVEISILGRVEKEGGRVRFARRASPPYPGEPFVPAPNDVVERSLTKDRDLLLGEGVGGFQVYMPLEAFRKHVAVLAMSGAGKSNLVKNMLLQLHTLPLRPGVVVLDMHGEYGALEAAVGGRGRVEVVDLAEVKIGFSQLTPGDLRLLLPNISDPRLEAYKKALREAKEKGITTLEGFRDALESRAVGPQKGGGMLATMLREVDALLDMGVVGEESYPTFEEWDLSTTTLIFDASSLLGLSEVLHFKASYILKTLFAKRREGRIPPTVVFVEEAHNLFSERGPARVVGERVAREGRKYGLSLVLITQRPSHISQTVLSQCNTHILMRIMNPNDQQKVRESVEGASQSVLNSLPVLETGEGILVGEAVNFPIFFRSPKVDLPNQNLSYKELLEEFYRKRGAVERATPSAEDALEGL